MTGILCAIACAGGGVGGTVATPDLNPNASNPGGVAVAVLSLSSAGAYSATNDLSGDYCTPASLASQLDARLTVNSGFALTGAATGVWLNLGTTRSWSLTAAPGETRLTDCTLLIRETATGTVRDTSAVSFSAEGL